VKSRRDALRLDFGREEVKGTSFTHIFGVLIEIDVWAIGLNPLVVDREVRVGSVWEPDQNVPIKSSNRDSNVQFD
jgi:hypothetical protein